MVSSRLSNRGDRNRENCFVKQQDRTSALYTDHERQIYSGLQPYLYQRVYFLQAACFGRMTWGKINAIMAQPVMD